MTVGRAMVVAVVVALTASACVDDARVASVPGVKDEARPADVREDLVPAEIVDLTATPEDVSDLEKEAGSDSYLADVRLWSLRTGPRLRATLQVGRFVADASPDEEDFQEVVVGQIGQSEPRRRTLAGTRVYVTSSNQQAVYLWFRNRHLFVLSVASDYGNPRAVLRSALELAP